MPKYYVSSGELQRAIDRPKPKDAAVAAFNTLKERPVKLLGKLTMVSEHGFDSEADDDIYFCTVDLLDETDQLENYLHCEWMDDDELDEFEENS
jgi:hypothetical protein